MNMESPKTSTDEDAEKPLTPAERRQQLLRMKIRRSFNMFNMNDDRVDAPLGKVPKSDVADQLKNESAEWNKFMADAVKTYGETVPAKTVDTSILNSEQKLFLDGAIDVKEWMEQSNSFRRHVEVHMKTMQQYAMANKSFDQLMDYQLDRTALRACVMESAFFGIGKEE